MRTNHNTGFRKNRSSTILPLPRATRSLFVGVMVVSWKSDHYSVVAVWLPEEKAIRFTPVNLITGHKDTEVRPKKEVCLRSSLGGCPVEANQWDLNAMSRGKHCALNAHG
jgi:hypothetical protein